MEAFAGVIIGPIVVLFVLSVALEWLFGMKVSDLFQWSIGRFILWTLVIGSVLFGLIGGVLSL